MIVLPCMLLLQQPASNIDFITIGGRTLYGRTSLNRDPVWAVNTSPIPDTASNKYWFPSEVDGVSTIAVIEVVGEDINRSRVTLVSRKLRDYIPGKVLTGSITRFAFSRDQRSFAYILREAPAGRSVRVLYVGSVKTGQVRRYAQMERSEPDMYLDYPLRMPDLQVLAEDPNGGWQIVDREGRSKFRFTEKGVRRIPGATPIGFSRCGRFSFSRRDGVYSVHRGLSVSDPVVARLSLKGRLTLADGSRLDAKKHDLSPTELIASPDGRTFLLQTYSLSSVFNRSKELHYFRGKKIPRMMRFLDNQTLLATGPLHPNGGIPKSIAVVSVLNLGVAKPAWKSSEIRLNGLEMMPNEVIYLR